MNKELYEAKRLIEMENIPSAWIPSYEQAKELVKRALIENKQYPIDAWRICLMAEETADNPDTFIPMELFKLIVEDTNVVQ